MAAFTAQNKLLVIYLSANSLPVFHSRLDIYPFTVDELQLYCSKQLCFFILSCI